MWSRDALADLVARRRESRAVLQRADEAILAYARWHGLTAEPDVDRASAKAALDEICDATEPEEWSRLKELAGNIDDQILRGVMHYALTRSLSQLREQQRDFAQSASTPEPESPSPTTRRRSRSRNR